MAERLCAAVGDYVCRMFYPERMPEWLTAAVTLFAALAALSTLRSLRQQNSIAREALDDNKRAFALANRARLVVRRVVITEHPDRGNDNYAAYVDIGNVGATAARVIAAKAAFAQWEAKTAPPAEMHFEKIAAPAQIAAGETVRIPWAQPEITVEEHFGFRNRTDSFFAVGRVIYEDGAGFRRELAFCRRLDYETLRFEPIDDPDHEYAD